jgi:hypothetical protein
MDLQKCGTYVSSCFCEGKKEVCEKLKFSADR